MWPRPFSYYTYFSSLSSTMCTFSLFNEQAKCIWNRKVYTSKLKHFCARIYWGNGGWKERTCWYVWPFWFFSQLAVFFYFIASWFSYILRSRLHLFYFVFWGAIRMYFILLYERFFKFYRALQFSKGSHTQFHIILFVVVQLLSCVWLFATPWTVAWLPCRSPLPRVCSDSCASSQWCYLTISSSVAPSPSAFNHSQHQGLFQWVGSYNNPFFLSPLYCSYPLPSPHWKPPACSLHLWKLPLLILNFSLVIGIERLTIVSEK